MMISPILGPCGRWGVFLFLEAIREEFSIKRDFLGRLVVKRGNIVRRLKYAEHAMDGRNSDHRFAEVRSPFVVFAVTAIPTIPNVGPFENPTKKAPA